MKMILTLAILLALLSAPTAFGASSTPADSASREMSKDVLNTSPIAALKDLYEKNAEFHATMDKAFANMKDPDPNTADLWPSPRATNPWTGEKFDDLLQFFSEWYLLKPTPNGTWDEFNYIEKFAWFYYENEFGQKIVGKDPGLNWTKQFVEARREFLESQQSTETISQWLVDPSIHMEQYIIPPDGFKSFNQFFIRDLKPGMRTIASPLDDSVLVSPTDCVLNMIEPLTPGAKIPTKLNQKLNVTQLLNGSKYVSLFENGTAISCILMPTTYHHYHSVVSGKVVESDEDISGAYWGIKDFAAFYNARNFGYGANYSVFEQFRRGYLVIKTDEYGYVAMIPVGLDTIGSVVFEDKFAHVSDSNPVPVYKGEKLGHFEYGGSLVITLIQQGISSITTQQGQQIGVFSQCQECKAEH
ncbi:MAG: phosphatidylserine decarboxylase [Methanothrix sp.]|uniref:phosphatidylserine decarboxylase n=1 Tax=Methanothrix sp. TaxID=90426 RepID=UPI003BB783E6